MRLRAIRQTRKLTQAQLAKRAGVTLQYISHLETGRRQNPSLDVLVRLARVLRCDLKDLL